MHHQIKCRWTGDVLFEGKFDSFFKCVIAAIAAYAKLSGADLRSADLSGANLAYTSLRCTNLKYVDLSDTDLEDVDLTYADLRNANLKDAKNADLAIACTRILPEGDIIGWKKCRSGAIVKLRIPAEAKRSHAFGRKCRAEFADVLEIIGADVGVMDNEGSLTVYSTGERVIPDSFDEDWTDEYSHGIHFFITRAEAEAC
jgi:hypothetical protein